jgi:hypothetical protein
MNDGGIRKYDRHHGNALVSVRVQLHRLCGLWAAVCALALPLLVGCGGVPDAVRVSLTATAQGVAELDRSAARRYAEAADEAREAAPVGEEGWASYDVAMRPWELLRQSINTAFRALVALQEAANAWEQGSDGEWLSAAGCMLALVATAVEAARALGIEIPAVLEDGLATASRYAPRCAPE